ncbi:JmjC domain-containing protein [Streptomyces johnsoniae]|uniref:Cupin domain-containing protein n=1 Tax=Streptomyces johnsoniae TaxID=3075532 RepID=A0ABU2SCR1_9ACTN|nr:cupin domain-containing protein [Streptomyces sp. DSM 41886]MDT0446756.1 cupin domain-containing protein [Streptomyces sp. DSM 41886]
MSLRLLLSDDPAELLRAWPHDPILYRRGRTELDDTVTLPLLYTYIDHALLDPRYVAALKDGLAVHPGRYTRDGQLLPAKLRALHEGGHTVNLREVQRAIPYLAELSANLRRETGYPNNVSAIITPPGSQGLTHHWDQFTGIITQLVGRKRWPLWRPVVDRPTGDYQASPSTWTPELQKRLEQSQADLAFTLTPGDTLVVPRGWLHSPHAIDLDEVSFHLTFAIHERTNLWLAQQLIGLAIEHAGFRSAIPPDLANLKKTVSEVREEAIGFLRSLDPVYAAERLARAVAE